MKIYDSRLLSSTLFPISKRREGRCTDSGQQNRPAYMDIQWLSGLVSRAARLLVSDSLQNQGEIMAAGQRDAGASRSGP